MKSKVFIQQAILPPYRLAFFQALSASSQLDITMAYGESQESSALKSLQGPKGVRHLPVLNRAIGKGPTALWQSGILDLFKRENPDVLIQSLDPRILSNWRLARLARRMGKKVIVWGHGIRPSGRFRNLYAKIATSADAVILYSGHGKRGLAEVGVPDSNMFVAWNSIDTRTISGLRASTPLEDRTDVLYIGRMIADKKILLLLEAFALALPQLPSRVQLALLGGKPIQSRKLPCK
jgi:glycosyltransferase involved in cell wall biosynthesis